jgi:hypothetical protein
VCENNKDIIEIYFSDNEVDVGNTDVSLILRINRKQAIELAGWIKDITDKKVK